MAAKALYQALSRLLTPLVQLHLLARRWRRLEHPTRWPERLGYASVPRPPGPLLWFHAVSLGEGLAAIPAIKKCIQTRPHVNILLTTTTVSAFRVIENIVPVNVICQFVPVDTPAAVGRFLVHWHPQAVVFMESELWPNLLLMSSARKVPLVLLNARISLTSFRSWAFPAFRPLVEDILSSFSLICPLSTDNAVRLQILGAPPHIIQFGGDLKYAVAMVDCCEGSTDSFAIPADMKERPHVWLAASTHNGEEEVMARVHKHLKSIFPHLLTVIAPRHQERGPQIETRIKKAGLNVVRRSSTAVLLNSTDVYIVDTTGELRFFYKFVPIAFVGGSCFRNLAGHNLVEAAAAGCAVITGPHIGHFRKMLNDMQKLSPLSVQQVRDETDLAKSLSQLLTNPQVLNVRREAARKAALAAANGVIEKIWSLLDTVVLQNVLGHAYN